MDYTRRHALVSDDDAVAIADAIERTLDDIPNHDAVAHKVISTLDLPFGRPLRALNPLAEVSPYEYFCGEGKARLVKFIGFCRCGGFRIA